MTYSLSLHQRRAVENLSNGKILRGDVGAGKSLTALGYYLSKETPRDIYVITTAKKRDSHDWEREAKRIGLPSRVSLVVDSWNNISRYTEIRDAFFIFDEQRLVGSGAWVRSFLKIAKINRWILLTATPGDTWVDYAPVFIANGFYKNHTQFLTRHAVYSRYTKYPKVDRYVEVGHLEKLRRLILVEMPFERDTVRHIEHIPVAHDPAAFARVREKRWNVFDDRPIKDVGELFYVMRKVVNTAPSRVGFLRGLLEKHPRIIVFYNFDYELKILREFGEEAEALGMAVGELNGHRHDPLPKTDRWLYFVQYLAGAEGWNCTETNAMVFYSMSYSYRMMEQAKGRIDRMNTPFIHLFYYILVSDSMIDGAIRKSLVSKRSFNEAAFYKTSFPAFV